jgi:hypothetical protein
MLAIVCDSSRAEPIATTVSTEPTALANAGAEPSGTSVSFDGSNRLSLRMPWSFSAVPVTTRKAAFPQNAAAASSSVCVHTSLVSACFSRRAT